MVELRLITPSISSALRLFLLPRSVERFERVICLSSEACVSSHEAKTTSGVLVCLKAFRIQRLGGQNFLICYIRYLDYHQY